MFPYIWNGLIITLFILCRACFFNQYCILHCPSVIISDCHILSSKIMSGVSVVYKYENFIFLFQLAFFENRSIFVCGVDVLVESDRRETTQKKWIMLVMGDDAGEKKIFAAILLLYKILRLQEINMDKLYAHSELKWRLRMLFNWNKNI